MRLRFLIGALLLLTLAQTSYAQQIDGWFYETANGRHRIPLGSISGQTLTKRIAMPDNRIVTLIVQRSGRNFDLSLKAQPDSDILKWGISVASKKDEYYTGLMERVVDGPQRASWAPGLHAAMR
jgi:hypothetical protein